MKTGLRQIVVQVATVALLAGSACSQVLGIEDAYEDPNLTQNAGGSQGQPVVTAGAPTDDPKGSGGDSSSGESGNSNQNPSAGSAGTGAGESALCIEYCSTVRASCDPQDPTKSRLPQYADAEQCFTVCSALDPGEPGDRGVDTVHCRLRHAKMAQYEIHECANAGPHGGGECGKPCEVYCKMMMNTCTESSTDTDTHYFASMAACMDACGKVPNGAPYSATEANYTGEHLQCRIYHGVISMMGGAAEHCEHAIGETLCVSAGSGGAAGSSG